MTAAGCCRRGQDYKPEFVFVDLAMPALDGYEVARQLRECAGLDGTKILALSGYPPNGERESESGIDGHIAKPITAVRLKSLLGNGW